MPKFEYKLPTYLYSSARANVYLVILESRAACTTTAGPKAVQPVYEIKIWLKHWELWCSQFWVSLYSNQFLDFWIWYIYHCKIIFCSTKLYPLKLYLVKKVLNESRHVSYTLKTALERRSENCKLRPWSFMPKIIILEFLFRFFFYNWLLVILNLKYQYFRVAF